MIAAWLQQALPFCPNLARVILENSRVISGAVSELTAEADCEDIVIRLDQSASYFAHYPSRHSQAR